eukprot:1545773-Pyramimonas_sp.AAC.1
MSGERNNFLFILGSRRQGRVILGFFGELEALRFWVVPRELEDDAWGLMKPRGERRREDGARVMRMRRNASGWSTPCPAIVSGWTRRLGIE